MTARNSRPRPLVTLALLGAACLSCGPAQERPASPGDPFEARRALMVARQLQARGIEDPLVLSAMRKVPREAFVPDDLRDDAYADRPLPIAAGQTISQPYIVALMTELAGPRPGDRARRRHRLRLPGGRPRRAG